MPNWWEDYLIALAYINEKGVIIAFFSLFSNSLLGWSPPLLRSRGMTRFNADFVIQVRPTAAFSFSLGKRNF